jgi:hypothetical protein
MFVVRVRAGRPEVGRGAVGHSWRRPTPWEIRRRSRRGQLKGDRLTASLKGKLNTMMTKVNVVKLTDDELKIERADGGVGRHVRVTAK